MADPRLQIVLQVRDMASGAFRRVADSTRQYSHSLERAQLVANGATLAIRNLVAAIGSFAAIRTMVTTAFEFNSTIEDTQVGLAGLVYTMHTYKDAAGNTLEPMQAFNSAMYEADSIQNRLRIDGLRTAATYEELANAFSQAYAPAMRAGFDHKQINKFVTSATMAAAALRVPMFQLGEEVRSILAGTMVPRNTRLMPIMEAAGLTNEKIRELAKNGGLFEAIMEAMRGAVMAGERAAMNFTVKWSNFKDAVAQGLGQGLKGSFEKTKDYLEKMTNAIFTFDEETAKIKWNEKLLDPLEKLDKKVWSIIDGIVGVSKAIYDFTQAHSVITDIATDVGGLLAKFVLGSMVLRQMTRVFLWGFSIIGANIRWVISLLGGMTGGITLAGTAATIAAGGVAGLTAALGAAAGAGLSFFGGWKIGKWLSEWDIAGLKVKEYVQIYFAEMGKIDHYAAWVWNRFKATTKLAWAQIEAAVNDSVYGILEAIREVPGSGMLFKFLGIDMEAMFQSSARALNEAKDAYAQAVSTANARLQHGLEIQDLVIKGIKEEAAARRQVNKAEQEGLSILEMKRLGKGWRTPPPDDDDDEAKGDAWKKQMDQGLSILDLRRKQIDAIAMEREAVRVSAADAELKYQELTGSIKDQLRARIEALKAHLAQDLADTGKALHEKADLYKTTMAEIEQAEKELHGKFADGWRAGWKKIADETKTDYQKGKEFAENLANSIESAFNDINFTDAEQSLKSFGDFFKAILYSLEREVMKFFAGFIKEALASSDIMKGLFGTSGGLGIGRPGSQGTNWFGKIFDWGKGLLGFSNPSDWGGLWQAFHSGGVVGRTPATQMRWVPDSAIASAPRFHRGLMPGEFPAVLQEGETVLPRGAQAGGGTTVHIGQLRISALDALSFEQMTSRNPAAIVKPLISALQDGDRGLVGTMQKAMQY